MNEIFKKYLIDTVNFERRCDELIVFFIHRLEHIPFMIIDLRSLFFEEMNKTIFRKHFTFFLNIYIEYEIKNKEDFKRLFGRIRSYEQGDYDDSHISIDLKLINDDIIIKDFYFHNKYYGDLSTQLAKFCNEKYLPTVKEIEYNELKKEFMEMKETLNNVTEALNKLTEFIEYLPGGIRCQEAKNNFEKTLNNIN